MPKKALVIGASGLIGRNLVFELLKSSEYEKVTVLVRSDMSIKHPKFNQILLNFENLADYESDMAVDDVYCCMGTTRAKTPDPDSYRKIDFDYPLETSRLARKQGASQFLLVSAMGADPESRIFYNRLKGDLEAALANVGYPTLIITRPSLLLGSRNESRPLETISQYLMRVLNPLFLGPLMKYKAIQGNIVAKALLKAAGQNLKGKHIILNDALFKLAR